MISKILNRFRKAESYRTKSIAGVSLVCTPGVFRATPDYDDAWYYALAKRANRILDIGANKGYTAILALISNSGNKELLLVDANSHALGMACENICMNNLKGRVMFHQALVADTPGVEMEFYSVGAGDAGSIHASHAKTASKLGMSRLLPTSTIDHILQEFQFNPDLVKIDVEGAETNALKGADSLGSTEARIFVEMHRTENLSMKDAAETVLDWARSRDRTVYYLKRHQELTSGKEVEHRGKCHFLILKNSDSYPDYLRQISQGDEISHEM